MAERDAKGRFIKGSAATFGRRGGLARIAKLSPEERAELARSGLQALADRYFDGDAVAAQRWLSERGLAALRGRQ